VRPICRSYPAHPAAVTRRGRACAACPLHRVRTVGLARDREDESQFRARVCELGCVEMLQQMSNRSVGAWVRHRMNLHTQKTPLHVRQLVGLRAKQIAQCYVSRQRLCVQCPVRESQTPVSSPQNLGCLLSLLVVSMGNKDLVLCKESAFYPDGIKS
jgi:hypothetical protein